ncbi:MAG: hypothetical protein HRT71_18160 [Flavobacteriales bacterium]|nr:hypothetical protein [Flavobacteriales bacterium]
MKKVILSLCLIIVSALTFGQESKDRKQIEPSKGHIGLSLGSAIPLGEFSAKTSAVNGPSESSGFAHNGVNLNLYGAYYFGMYLGLTAMISNCKFYTSGDQIKYAFVEIDPSIDWKTRSGRWKTSCYMVGLISSFPINSFLLTLGF